ncbi:MAG: LysR family transcriptional regulator [Lachnospiraceae bacterium]|nr:LysR family transcriptional regulator [Lachnospiraceae bacterium]
MTLRHLQIFLMVCEKGNMTEAANTLFMTQPSVSQAIKELETHYEVRLFNRAGRKISLTRSGEILRSYAVHITNSFAELDKKLRSTAQSHALRIGANVTVGVTMIQSLICRFKEMFPGIRVEIFVNNSKAILERIDRDELDLALVEEFAGMENYITEPFFNDRSIVVAPIGHPLLEKKEVTAKDLTETELLLRESGSGVRNLFDAVMFAKGLVVHPIWESYTSDAVIEAVRANIGVAVLPERIARPHIRNKEMSELPIRDLDLSRRLVILRHRSKILSPEGEAFAELVRTSDWDV